MDLEEEDFDYYDILNVKRDSSPEEIKANYRRLIRQWHPDKNMARPDETVGVASVTHRRNDMTEAPQELKRNSAFNKIHRAYMVLSDTEQRRIYDMYGSEGINIRQLLQKQAQHETVQSHTIEEEVQEEDAKYRNEEMRRIEGEQELESRLHDILSKRRWDRFRERPIQVVTKFTFLGVTSLFDDEITTLVRRKLFYISKSSVNNSVEIAISNRTRLGYTYRTSIARSTFGSSKGAIYLSSHLGDTVMSTLSVDCGNYLGYKSATLSLKKMFSEHFWLTSILSVDRYLTPSIRFLVHKNWASRHAIEVSALPSCGITHGYNRRFGRDLKINLQSAFAPEDIGTLLRVKAMSNRGAVVGTTCKLSLNGGLTLEGYMRQRVETESLAKMKMECRLRFRVNSLHMIFKVVLNNTHVELPIELYTGDVDYCVFLGTATACTMAMLPVLFEGLRRAILPCSPSFEREPPLKSMRHTFYTSFPTFAYLGNWWDSGRKHEKYVSDFGKDVALMNKTEIWSEEMLESIVSKEVRLAQQEGVSLLHNAMLTYQKEADIDGLCIMFAVYGHPEAINRLEELITMETFENIISIEEIVATGSPRELALESARKFVYGSVTVGSILKQNNQLRLQKLFERYVIDVTNALMSRVADSRLEISDNSKKQLIGFANTCENIFNVEPELYIVYRYQGRTGTTRLRDSEPIVLPI